MARTVGPGTRRALVSAATELFYARGVGAVAVDEIAADAGLSKPTLYRHFRSKDELVAAYLDDRHQQLDRELRAWIDRAPQRQRPAAVIDWLCAWVSSPDFNGCGFVRSQAELPEDAQVRERARERKRVLLETIQEACRTAGSSRADELALQLTLIVEGATTMAFVSGPAEAVKATRALFQAALNASGAKG